CLSRAPSLLVSPRAIRWCIRSGNSSLVTLPSLFLSNAIIRSTMSSTRIGAGRTSPRGGPCFWSGDCATPALVRVRAAIRAAINNSWMLRMLVLLCGGETTSLERVRELRIGEELLVGQRLQEGKERGLLGIREFQLAHPGVEVGVC